MSNWIITKREHLGEVHSNYERTIEINHGYVFSFKQNSNSYYYNTAENSGIFIFGYFLPRLNSSWLNKDLQALYSLLLNETSQVYDEIKGCFTIILIKKGVFSIFNDPLGLSKFFYSTAEQNLIFSDAISPLKRVIGPSISSNFIFQYHLFNYQLNGDTFFENIKYSEPGTLIEIDGLGNKKKQTYFDIVEHLSKNKTKLSNKETFSVAEEVWSKILTQWQQIFQGEKVSLSLTAGLDSRIILGGFLKTEYNNFDTFTFGHPNSQDVFYAKELAKKFRQKHKHLYSESLFWNSWVESVNKTYSAGQSLVSAYRTHRFDAYSQLMKSSSGIFMGLAGSDLVRGIGYDGLIVTPIAQHCWNKKSMESFLQSEDIKNHYIQLGVNQFDFILDRKDEYSYMFHPMHYLFKVVIPLHFGQDILMNQSMGWKTIVPFLDPDYLDFLIQTPYFSFDSYNNYKSYNFKNRWKGLYYSAKLCQKINYNLSSFSIGKGYSPNDIVKSQLLTTYKHYNYNRKKSNMKFEPNFSLGKWYWQYLRDYLDNHNMEEVGLNHKYLSSSLNKIEKKGGEYHFVDYTRAVNVHLALTI